MRNQTEFVITQRAVSSEFSHFVATRRCHRQPSYPTYRQNLPDVANNHYMASPEPMSVLKFWFSSAPCQPQVCRQHKHFVPSSIDNEEGCSRLSARGIQLLSVVGSLWHGDRRPIFDNMNRRVDWRLIYRLDRSQGPVDSHRLDFSRSTQPEMNDLFVCCLKPIARRQLPSNCSATELNLDYGADTCSST